MKRNITLTLFALLLAFAGISQTATSIANGNWTSPATWSCSCVPLPGYTVTINHNVTLNTSFAYTSGSITINAGGALITDLTGRDLWINGGSFSNSGNLDVHFLMTSTGTFANSGTITARAYSNFVNFTNTGTFQLIDSMRNNATLINNGSFLTIDSITNNGTFTNNGTCTYNQFTNNGTYTNTNNLTFTDITNNGTFTNTSTMLCTHSAWNRGLLTNTAPAFFTLNKSLLNQKPGAGTACINNNGRIAIADSYYNFDTIKGTTGGISVQDSSVNYGHMLQSFDFCDYTPNPSPNIDYNFGTISPTITYCVNTGIKEENLADVLIYPNPARSQLNIRLGEIKNCEVKLYSSQGTMVADRINSGFFDTSMLSEGLYFVTIQHGADMIIKKVQIIK